VIVCVYGLRDPEATVLAWGLITIGVAAAGYAISRGLTTMGHAAAETTIVATPRPTSEKLEAIAQGAVTLIPIVIALLFIGGCGLVSTTGPNGEQIHADPETIAGGVGAAVSIFNPALGGLIATCGTPVIAYVLKRFEPKSSAPAVATLAGQPA
jgi:hypothetical protein